jgi:hypothetical protein
MRPGIGGSALYYVVPCVYNFTHDDGMPHEIDGDIRIAQIRDDNLGLPSLLGWDILRHFEIAIDFRADRVVLS